MSESMDTVVVIGGGFSGVVVTAHLLRQRDRRVVLVDSGPATGRGIAYGSPDDTFLLNVPAAAMSAWPDRPDNFLQWLRQRMPSADAGTFAPRRLYGDYLAEILQSSCDNGLDVVRDEAVDLEPRDEGFSVTLASGTVLACDRVVLALGNAPPRPLVHDGGERWSTRIIENPLSTLDTLRPASSATIAIIGTCLTALDVMNWLHAHGHRGQIVAISRRGLAPVPHQSPAPPMKRVVPDEIRTRPNVRRVMRWLRETGASLAEEGIIPARAIDALRPVSAEMWQGLSAPERARFFRHVRPYWNVNRHRSPPSIATAIARGAREGRIVFRAARFVGYTSTTSGGLQLRLERTGEKSKVDVDWLLNCTGPERDLTRHPGRLVRSLLRKRLVQPDDFGLGVRTTAAGELIDGAGRVLDRAYVIGGWRMADLWESTAVPELRVQAAQVAETIGARIPTRPVDVDAV